MVGYYPTDHVNTSRYYNRCIQDGYNRSFDGVGRELYYYSNPIEGFSHNDKYEVVVFHMTGCGPCKMLLSELKGVKQSDDGMPIRYIESRDPLARKYNISGFPTIVVLKNGKEVGRESGARPRREFMRAVKNLRK